MPKFSEISKQRLITCHPELVRLFNEVVKYYDCTILQGSRADAEQRKAFQEGNSKLDGVNKKSKHQVDKEHPFSRAADVAPAPLDWKDKERFYHFAGMVQGIAQMLNINIIWGGDWDNDNDFRDNKFNDLVHFELADV